MTDTLVPTAAARVGAPSAMDPAATVTPTAPHAPDRAPDPAGSSALTDLPVATRRACESAVDATDVEVLLEAAGVTDMVAARAYGAGSTHELAARVFATTPTRAAEAVVGDTARPAAARIDDAMSTLRLIARGVLYAAPGTFYLAIAKDLRSGWMLAFVVGVCAAGWAVSQGVGLIGYRLASRFGEPAAAAALRRVALLSVPAAVAIFLVATPIAGNRVAGVLAAQIVCVSASAVLLFHGEDRRLAVALLPGAALAVVAATVWAPPWPHALAQPLAIGTAFAVVAAACAPDDTAAPCAPNVEDVAAAVPNVTYGLLCAAILASPPIRQALDPAAPPDPSFWLAILPIVLVMGYAEVAIRRLRHIGITAAARQRSVAAFRRQVLRALAATLLRVLAALSLLSAAVTLVATVCHVSFPLTRSATSVVLGGALMAGLVVSAFGRVALALIADAVVAGALAVGRSAGVPLHLALPSGQLVACLLLLTGTASAAAYVVCNPVTVVS